MSNAVIREYAMRKARQEAQAFISKQTRDLSNDAITRVIGAMLSELEREVPAKAFCLDFLDVLNSVN